MVHEAFPYLTVPTAAKAIDFYVRAFGATERFRLVDPTDGRIGHAEIEFAPGVIVMLADPYPSIGLAAPGDGPHTTSIHLHVDDCDAFVARAEEAGATVTMRPTDQFYGERSAALVDPFGHRWLIGHSLETVEPEEMQRRWDAM